MKYGKISGINKKASRIVFGCAIRSMLKGMDAEEILSAALSFGVNVYDTARVYGDSEKSLGYWIRKQNRKEIILSTKCCHYDAQGKRVSRAHCLYDIEKSLECLQTSYTDILLLHRDDTERSVEEIISFMNEVIDKGYTKAIGVSNWTTTRIAQANEYARQNGLIPFSVSSPYYGLAEQVTNPWGDDCVSIAGQKFKSEREWYRKQQMPVFAYASLACGFLSGKYRADTIVQENPSEQIRKGFLSAENIERLRRAEILALEKGVPVAQIAMAWLFGGEMDTYAIVGCSSVQTLQSNVDACEVLLSPQEQAWLNLEV